MANMLLLFCALFRVLSSTNMYVNCTQRGDLGCSQSGIIDGSAADSLSVDCQSSNAYSGGCQLIKILCPLHGDCTINCNDYYSCYHTNITSASTTTTSSVTLNCQYSDSSCVDTVLNVENINALNINCIGYTDNDEGIGSLSSVTCHNMLVNGNNIRESVNIHCDADYACSNNVYHFNNSVSTIHVHSMGLYSFYNNILYAFAASFVHLFCGSEAYSKYNNHQFGGCINSSLYLPPHTNNIPNTLIKCEGEGCYGPLNIYAINGGLDVNISLNTCNECHSKGLCIHEWNLYCGNGYNSREIFTGDACVGMASLCNCAHTKNTLANAYTNNDMLCDIFETDYICRAGVDCVINCNEHFVDGCKNKLINGASAKSLSVICNGDNNNDKSCSNARISCPTSEDNNCDILCNGANSCVETVIHATDKTKHLNVTCIEKDACSYTEINALTTYDITMQCIVSDACDNFNIYANYSNSLSLTCEPRDIDTVNEIYSSAYAACNHFNVFADNNREKIEIYCDGDFSCMSPNIYAANAMNLLILAQGQYALYTGNIYAQNMVSKFALFCTSQFGEQGCYKPNLYVPQYNDMTPTNEERMDIYCKGHGCYRLNLYAVNGWSDVNIAGLDGCQQCESISACVQLWTMQCGGNEPLYTEGSAIFDGQECHTSQCDCASMIQNIDSAFLSSAPKDCGFFAADIECEVDKECVIDCANEENGCDGKTISGANANSLVINCDSKKGCAETKVYCPIDKNSRCDIKCLNKHSCYLTEVYGDEYNLINMDCLAINACTNTSIIAPDAKELNLLCFAAHKACQHLSIEVGFANVVNILCNAGNATDEHSHNVCDNFQVIGSNISHEFNLECYGNNACQNMQIFVETANITSINAIGIRALYSGAIHAEYASVVNILSYSDDYIWCANELHCTFDLYLPSQNADNTRFICQGYGCYNLNIYSQNGLIDYTFQLNGCGLCDKQYFCYSDWHIFCGKRYQNELAVWSGSECYDNVCGCTPLIQQSLTDSWDAYNSLTCDAHNSYNFTCVYDENGYCVINCVSNAFGANDCVNKVINATTLTSSIIVKCGLSDNDDVMETELGLCENSKIYCPTQADTECVVLCSQDDSCTNLKIYSESTDTNALWLNCSDYGSCEFTKVIAPDLKEINIFCDNTDACYGLNVEATNVENVNIVCKSSEQTYDYRNYYYDYYDYWDDMGNRRLLSGQKKRRRLQRDNNGRYDYDWEDYYDYDYDYNYDYYDNYDWDYESNFACDEIVIDANYSENVNIFCKGNSSCFYSLFYASYANHINLTAIGQDSMYYGYLYANNANEVNIKCWSAYDYGKSEDAWDKYYYDDYDDYYTGMFGWFEQGACKTSSLYIPTHSNDEAAKTNLICEGYGCYDLNIYSIRGLNDMNVIIDGCKVCETINECIGKWSMNCGEYHYSDYDYYNGKTCIYGACDCNNEQIIFRDSVECAYNWNNYSTNGTTNNGHRLRGHSKGEILIIVFVVIGIVLLFVVSYCVYKRRKVSRINSEINNQSQAQPMHMNMSNVVSVEKVGSGSNKNDSAFSENLARALAMEAVEGHETTKNKSATMVSAQFVGVSGGLVNKNVSKGKDSDKVGLIN